MNKNFDAAKFYENLAQKYPEELMNNQTDSIINLDFFVHDFLRSVSGPLVDFGCGQGRYACWYEHGSVLGIDIAPTNIKIASVRSRVLKDKIDRRFIVADLTKPLDKKYKGYSVLICIEVLEHIPDLGCVVENMYDLLNDGGLILITTPGEVKNGWIRSDILKEFGIDEEYFHGGYSPETLTKIFGSKFRILKSGVVPKVPKSFIIASKTK